MRMANGACELERMALVNVCTYRCPAPCRTVIGRSSRVPSLCVWGDMWRMLVGSGCLQFFTVFFLKRCSGYFWTCAVPARRMTAAICVEGCSWDDVDCSGCAFSFRQTPLFLPTTCKTGRSYSCRRRRMALALSLTCNHIVERCFSESITPASKLSQPPLAPQRRHTPTPVRLQPAPPSEEHDLRDDDNTNNRPEASITPPSGQFGHVSKVHPLNPSKKS